MLYPRTYIAWDLETSGLDPNDSKILEIGAVLFRDGEVAEQKSWLLNHRIPIPEVITKITTLTKAQLDAEGGDPEESVNEFLSWFDRHGWPNLTHNGFRFDIPFLLQAVKSGGLHTPAQVEEIKERLYRNGVDSAALYKGKELGLERMWNENFAQYAARVLDTKKYGLRYNIAHCCKELGIDTANMKLHRALGDIFLTNEIYKKLV
jgi:DNA polymerase III epsilon subunit-like protein